MNTEVMRHYGLTKEFDKADYFESRHSRRCLPTLSLRSDPVALLL